MGRGKAVAIWSYASAGKDGTINVLHTSKVLTQRLRGPIVFLVSVWTFTALSAQMSPMKPKPITHVERVELLSGCEGILKIAADSPISPRTQDVASPDRLVIDVPDAIPGTRLHGLAVHSGEIKDIRVGLFSANPPVTRIVVDWNSQQPYHVLSSGKTVVVKLNDGGAPIQTCGPPPSSGVRRFSSRVERVSLLAGSGVQLEIAANGRVTPQTQVLSDPDRLVIDFPDAIPGVVLHNLEVHRGDVKAVRAALFSANPPVTRIVVDLNRPQPYQVVSSGSRVVVKLSQEGAPAQVLASQPAPALPKLIVSHHGGLLSIHADRATLAEVLNEVHRETGADIELPPGAGQDKVVVDLGPARAGDVLTSLLNGSGFNFIVVGSADDPTRLQRVRLMPKTPGVLATDLAETAAQEQPQSNVSSSNGALVGSFRNENKEAAPLSAAAPVTTTAPAPPATPSPPATDEELFTPPPATPPDRSQPPPRF